MSLIEKYKIVEKDSWNYLSVDGEYYHKIKKVGNDILIIEPKGVQSDDFDLPIITSDLDRVFYEAFGGNRFYFIHDYANFKNYSVVAKREYINWILNNISLFKGIYFYNVSFLNEIQIKSGKLFSPKFKDVKVFENLDDVLEFIESNNTVLSSVKSVKDVQVNVEETNKYRIIELIGTVNKGNVDELVGYIVNLLSSNYIPSKQICSIFNLRRLKGNPFLYHKKLFLSLSTIEICDVIIVVDKKYIEKVRQWVAKYYSDISISCFVNNKDAIKFLLEKRNKKMQEQLTISNFRINGISYVKKTSENLVLQLGEHKKYINEIVNNNIVIAKLVGTDVFKKNDLFKINRHIENIVENYNVKKPYWLFIDLKELKGVTVKARKEFLDWLVANSKNIEYVVPYNLSKSLSIIAKFLIGIIGDKIRVKIAKDFEEGLKFYGNISDKIAESESINVQFSEKSSKEDLLKYISALEQENREIKRKQKESIDKLFDIFGRISWDENYEIEEDIFDEEDPFYNLFSVAIMLHGDINYMLEIKDQLIEKTKKSDRLKSAFLSNMSHEIRTPLNGIIGFTSLALEHKGVAEDVRGYLKIIDNSSNKLLNLINDIIDISKIEAGQVDIHILNCNLNSILDDLFQMFEKQASSKGVKLELINDGKLDNVLLDVDKINQILINLIGNALKFTNEGFVKFGYSIKGEKLLFFVSDSGIGMSKKEQEIIFDRFKQADDTTTRNYGGSGLGLSISKGLVELLGGEIYLKSEPGNGTEFFFEIPYIK